VTSPDSQIMLNLHNMLMPYGNWAAVDLTHTELVNLTAIHLLEARIMYKSASRINAKFKIRMTSGSRQLSMRGGNIALRLKGRAGYQRRLELARGREQGQQFKYL